MKDQEKFECADCGCFYWVEDRSNFECPNCYEDKDVCIMCENDFVIGETGNELGFCCSCSSNKNFPYDLNKYYEDYDNGKVIFKGFDTMDRGILKPYEIK